MTGPSASQSNEASAPVNPTSSDGQRALIEHLAQAVVGSPKTPRRTASDTPRAVAVPLLYTELYNEPSFGQDMTPTLAPVQIDPVPDVPTNGSSYKNRAASSPDLKPLQEIDSSETLSSDSSNHELPPPMDVPTNPSHAVVSRKERNGLKVPTQANMAVYNAGNLSPKPTTQGLSSVPLGPCVGVSTGTGNSSVDNNHNGRPDVAGNAAGYRIEPFDPQRAYPSDACIFVANLLEGAPDEKLAEALTVVFGRYGTVFVKIKRKANNMPYAFVQFTNARDAAQAMEGAKGARILDRACRIEPANSKRFWLVRCADGKRTSVAEVRQALEGQGASSIQEAPPMVLEALGIHHGIRVEFPQWDQSRDLRRTVGSRFIAEPLDEFALKRRQQSTAAAQARLRKPNRDDDGTNGARPVEDGKKPAEGPSRWSFMERYDRDRRSVFCGNLPSNVTESELRRAFGRTGGYVKSLEIIKCPHSAYAFIEFSRADVCETAIELMNGSDLRGMSMKVERKRTRVPGTSPSPTHGQRCATQPRRPGGLISQREHHNFTPLPSPGPVQTGFGTNFQQAQNGSSQPAHDKTGNCSPSPVTEAATQGHTGGGLAQHSAQYINYLRYLLSAQQHIQDMHAAQGLRAGQSSNDKPDGNAIRGPQDIRVQAGSQSSEHAIPTTENGAGFGGGPAMLNPFAIPYPLLPPNGGVFPTGVPFAGMPYGPPLSPTYPITPGHAFGTGNTVGTATANPTTHGIDHPLGAGQTLGTGTPLGQLTPNVVNMLNSASGLTSRSPMHGGDHVLGRLPTASPSAGNGVASQAFQQRAVSGQNGAQNRISLANAPNQGLNGGPDHGSH